jgi:hypothetical protein
MIAFAVIRLRWARIGPLHRFGAPVVTPHNVRPRPRIRAVAFRAEQHSTRVTTRRKVWQPETVDSAWQRQYREDAQQLGELGAALIDAEIPRVEVRVPRALAEKALAAWQRDGDEGPAEPESFEQRIQRHRAGTLGLIGLAIENSGHWTDDYVVVELGADLIGAAVEASDDLS